MSHDKTQFPRLEQLEPRLLLSGVPELMGVAADLAVETPVDMEFIGSIDSPRQSVMYQFTAEATSLLVVDMTAEGGVIDPYLSLYNEKGRRRKRNNNAYRGTLDSQLVYTVQPGESYYIRAQGRRKTTGEYRIRVQTTLDDDYGDTLETAGAVEFRRSGRLRLRGSVDHAADVDVIAFTATKTGWMQVNQTARRRRDHLDNLLYAYDAEGNLVASNESTVGSVRPNTMSLDVVAGQRYYIAVGAYQQATGRYTLKIKTHRVAPQPAPRPAPQPEPDPDPDPPADVVPGQQVTGLAVQTTDGLQLVVLGTDLADSITLSRTVTGITLSSGAGTEGFTGAFAGVTVYGFGGGDAVRLTNSMILDSVLYGGDGNDSLFAAGMGADVLYGGAGDDLLVSIGGAGDLVCGQDGLDSFWAGEGDVLGDVSSAEQDATAVHHVSAFYQPYTTDAGAPGYVPLEIAGQELTDPAITSYASGYANFADRPVFVNGPSYRDINQGSVGDCYMLATLASLADTDPQAIQQMIASLGDGSFAVRFYDGSTPVYLRIDADLPVSSGSSLAYAGFGSAGQMWVPLVEKAYAYYRYGQNSYSSLHGGWMSDVFRHVTGGATTYRSTTSLGEGTYSFLYTQLAGGHAVTLGSRYTASSPVVPAHAYMVKEVHTTDGRQYVTVYNPWGVDGRTWDDNYSDGLLTLSVDQVIQHFSAAVAC